MANRLWSRDFDRGELEMSEHIHAAVLRAIADWLEVQYEMPDGNWSHPFIPRGVLNPISHSDYKWRVATPAWQEALRQAVRDGKVVEFRTLTCGGEWLRSNLNDLPDRFDFDVSDADRYRIRPEPKPDVVRELVLYEINRADEIFPVGRFRLVTDGESGKTKSAEVLS